MSPCRDSCKTMRSLTTISEPVGSSRNMSWLTCAPLRSTRKRYRPRPSRPVAGRPGGQHAVVVHALDAAPGSDEARRAAVSRGNVNFPSAELVTEPMFFMPEPSSINVTVTPPCGFPVVWFVTTPSTAHAQRMHWQATRTGSLMRSAPSPFRTRRRTSKPFRTWLRSEDTPWPSPPLLSSR